MSSLLSDFSLTITHASWCGTILTNVGRINGTYLSDGTGVLIDCQTASTLVARSRERKWQSR